jgi:hypothetical protein
MRSLVFFILTLLFFSTSNLLSDEPVKIDVNELCKSKWAGEFDAEWSYIVTFNKDYTFKADLASEGGDTCVSGNYNIKMDTIIFKMNKIGLDKGEKECETCKYCEDEAKNNKDKNDYFSPYRYFENSEYVLTKSTFPMHFTEYLYCKRTDVKIWNNNKPVKFGTESKIEDYNVILQGVIKGKTISNVKFRKKPNINSEIYMFLDSFNEKNLDYVPKGTEIKIIAITKEKDNVNNIINSWYYIEVSTSHYYKRGWVFGEYIQKL